MSIDESTEAATTPQKAQGQDRHAKGKPSLGFILRCALVAAIVIGLGLIAYRGYRSNQAADAAIAELTRLSNNPTLIDAIIGQNVHTWRLKQSDIDALDRQYQLDVKTRTGIASELMARPASQMLKDYVDGAQDRIVLIMLMDKAGLNVADSRPTHDYWQGDEEKFTKTVPLGPGAMHWGGLERDDVTGRLMNMVARTVTDPKTGEPIGAIAIGYDRMALDR